MTLRSRSVRIDPALCKGHMECMRVCPTEAIRVWRGTAQLLPGHCIDCGQCLRACPTSAITPRVDSFTDFGRFRHTVAIPSPTLFSQFGREASPAEILAAIQRAGFDEVVDMSPAVEAVLLELRRVVREHAGHRPLISPFCPTVVRLIQVRYPDLVELIAPVESPQEVLAAATREHRSKVLGLRGEQIGIVYVTPCAAKMVGLKLQTRMQASRLDGAMAVSHIYSHLRSSLAENGAPSEAAPQDGVSGPGLAWALLGGQGASMEAESSLAVGGLQDVIRTFEDLEKGKLRDIDYLECRSCRNGCVDGCLMVENHYEARSKLLQLIRRRDSEISAERASVRALCDRSDLRSGPVVARPQPSLDSDMAKALEKMRRIEDLHGKLPQINCGACGSPTCRAFAEDVAQGHLEENDCAFLLQGCLRRSVSELSSLLDKLPQSNPAVPEGGS